MASEEHLFCEKCGRTLPSTEFYSSNNLEKYPNGGKLRTCKKCTTMHVDNWDPETFKPILKELDVPYIKEEWDKLLERYSKDPTKMTGMTVLGRYLSTMKLKQHKNERWADTEIIEQKKREEKIAIMKKQGYSGEEIENELSYDRAPPRPAGTSNGKPQSYEFEDDFSNDVLTLDLTEEDKIYLQLKWGKTYKPSEWVQLEQLYEDMMASYDIQGAGHIDTLKLICKTSLKANQLIDMGDIEGYQKLSKVYNELMKSGKFTAAQNKSESGDFVDSVGEIVELCEKEGYIERFYIEKPNDKVDFTIEDIKRYTRTLITEETHLTELVEAAIKANEREEANSSSSDTELDIVDELEATLHEFEQELETEDYEEFNAFLEDAEAADLKNLLSEEEEF